MREPTVVLHPFICHGCLIITDDPTLQQGLSKVSANCVPISSGMIRFNTVGRRVCSGWRTRRLGLTAGSVSICRAPFVLLICGMPGSMCTRLDKASLLMMTRRPFAGPGATALFIRRRVPGGTAAAFVFAKRRARLPTGGYGEAASVFASARRAPGLSR